MLLCLLAEDTTEAWNDWALVSQMAVLLMLRPQTTDSFTDSLSDENNNNTKHNNKHGINFQSFLVKIGIITYLNIYVSMN